MSNIKVGRYFYNIKVGRYFYLKEFTTSPTATRLRIDLTPNNYQLDAIKALCNKVLDPIREHFNKPVIVTSGLRTPELNKAIGGSLRSQHMLGEAADIKIEGVTSYEIQQAVKDLDLPFGQCIAYAPEKGGHLHISYSARGKNKETFMRVEDEGYINIDRAQLESLGARGRP